MSVTIGLVANVYNEANALPGWLETHSPFFDDIRVLHAGPSGEYSNDGTLEILKKWQIPVQFCAIDEGFGVVRSRALRMCPCDYVCILDCDERFYPVCHLLACSGTPTPHSEVDAILRTYDFRDLKALAVNWDNIGRLGADLRVEPWEVYDQGFLLRDLLNCERPDAVCTIRRHWHDFSMRRPTQNWCTDPDWQMRLVRNDESICFDPSQRMHERLVGAQQVTYADMGRGPYFDHFHFALKAQEVMQRAHDVAIYDCLNEGRRPPTWEEFKGV